jgi:hypothetical protein
MESADVNYRRNATVKGNCTTAGSPAFENLGAAANRRWPYHARVIKTFDAVGRAIV